MKKSDFLRNLKDINLPRSLLFFGSGHFFIDKYISQISSVLAMSDEIVKMYHNEYDFGVAKAHLSQNSLFGDKSLLIIKSEKKIPASDIKVLLELVQKSDTNFFLYGFYGADTKSVQTPFNKKNGAENVRLYPPSFAEARTILAEHAKNINLVIDGYALHHLLTSQEGDVELALNELDKLAILERPISVKEVDELVFAHFAVKLDTLLVQLLQKKNYTQNLEKLLESGEEPLKIITSLSTFVIQLFLFNTHVKLTGVADSKGVLGFKLPPQIEQERFSLCKLFKKEAYERMIKHLMQTELKLKSANIDKEAILYSSLIKLQTFL